jgi:hypothetical protein
VTVQDGQFTLISTEDELREIVAPIEDDQEALTYVLAVIMGRRIWPHAPRPYYGLELDRKLEYHVDVIEDTHVERAEDGYLVHLFLYDRWGCEHPTFYAIDVHVTPQGDVEQVSKEIVYVDPSGFCVE